MVETVCHSGNVRSSSHGCTTPGGGRSGPAAFRPVPPAIRDDSVRPMWSVMIPTHNCAEELRSTLQSVLEQDPGPQVMQIEVVDDHSTADDPEGVVNRAANGRVTFHRQSKNVGHTRNFNTCLARSNGRLVHLLHGDDAVRHGFYATMGAHLEAHPEVGAAFCRHVVINSEGRVLHVPEPLAPEAGVLSDFFEDIATGQRLQPPAMVVRRRVYEEIGGYDERIPSYGEDWEMWTRIASRYPVLYEPSALACYRVHSTSLSGRTLRTGQNMRDLRLVIEINRDVLPPARAAELTQRARRNNALGALRRALRLFDAGDRRGTYAQTREAILMSPSPRVATGVAGLLLRIAWRILRRRFG